MDSQTPSHFCFTEEKCQELIDVFQECDVDGNGALDPEEFVFAMQKLFCITDKDEMLKLHMKIDINCDGAVDMKEFITYFNKVETSKMKLDYRTHIFPRPFELIPIDDYRLFQKIVCLPSDEDKDFNISLSQQVRPYQDCNYLSISKDGLLKYWTDDFELLERFYLPEVNGKEEQFSHRKKMTVSDMLYIKELQQLAVNTPEREIIFYECDKFFTKFTIKHSLMNYESDVTTMNYTSNKGTALFAFGDSEGFLSILVSKDVIKNGLFKGKWFKEHPRRPYKVVMLSTLLRARSEDFLFVRNLVLPDVCSNMQYFPQINSFAICGAASTTMSLSVFLCDTKNIKTKVFKSRKGEYWFTCVEYSNHSEVLVTGGKDGNLRVWWPNNTSYCKEKLRGHKTSITHLLYNDMEKKFVSISADKNVRIWSDYNFNCTQSFTPDCLPQAPISSVLYNTLNNKLLVANRDVAICLGRGTDVFKETMTSFEAPVCGVLYHHVYKQLVSVATNGLVTVWDVLTGNSTILFNVCPEYFVGHTAIAFNETERMLITTSPDKKVRQWNCYTGEELNVLPVEVPEDVTGIICRNQRLFVASKNSNIILDLDLQGKDKKILKHHLLSDVCSMQLHEPLLIAASSNGNLVVWNLDCGIVHHGIFRESPQKCMGTLKGQTHTAQLLEKEARKTTLCMPKNEKNEKKACPVVLSLKTREANGNTATFLISDGGCISSWSFEVKAELMGTFRAVERDDAIITSMSTGKGDKTLLTGDSTGRVCLWDIQDFGFKKEDDRSSPSLLRSWQASLSEITSVICDPTGEKIFTAGVDHDVKLWTNTGYCVGVFGKDQWDPNTTQVTHPTQQADQKYRKRTERKRRITSPLLSSHSRRSGQAKVSNKTKLSNDAFVTSMNKLLESVRRNTETLNDLENMMGGNEQEEDDDISKNAHPARRLFLRYNPADKKESIWLKYVALPPISEKEHPTRTKLIPHPPDVPHLPPVSEKEHPTRTKLIPHPPDMPHLPPISEKEHPTRTKLIPHPPDMPHLPPISEKEHPTRTKLIPHPPDMPHLPPVSEKEHPTRTKLIPHPPDMPHLPPVSEKEHPTRTKLIPHPPDMPHLPPVSEKEHPTRTKLIPHPPDMPHLPPISEKEHPTRTKLIPHPPDMPHLPPISEKEHPTRTKLIPHPPDTSLIQEQTGRILFKSFMILNEPPVTLREYAPLPAISDRKHLTGTKLIPHLPDITLNPDEIARILGKSNIMGVKPRWRM